MAKEQRSYRRYDEAFKREAVGLTCESGRTVAGAARDLGISENNLWRWRQQLAKTGAGDEPSGEESAQAEVNRLNRAFTTRRPNQVWLSDITCVWTAEGWLYLAAVLDVYSRKIVGWALSEHIDGSLTKAALQQAVGRRQPEPGLLHHSDRGVQYAGDDYQELLGEWEMIGSMSRKGDCWDNAPMESFFGTLKRELIYHERFLAKADARAKIFEYIEAFYNTWRRHTSLGGMCPAEFERIHEQTGNQMADLPT